MKIVIIFLVALIASSPYAQSQYQKTAAISAGFNDDYILFDTCDIGYGKEITRGSKGDSCLILQYIKTRLGTEWLKIRTADTTGFVIIDFIQLDKVKLYDLEKIKGELLITQTGINWLLQCKKEYELKAEKAKIDKSNKIEKINSEFKTFLAKSDLFIPSYSFPESEYLKYPGFNVTLYNSHPKKVIKYIWFTIAAYNPVNDIVGTKTVQAIGPIEPNNFGDYKFEFLFKSNIIETCKITRIKMQYMDGSVISFDKPAINNILSKGERFWDYIERMHE